jgi:hypothetical protein
MLPAVLPLQSLLQYPGFFLQTFPPGVPLILVLDKAFGAVTEGDRKILSTGVFYLFHNLSGKPEPVFKRTAIFICPVVEKRDGKLIDEIPFMHGMDLNPVESRTLCIESALPELKELSPCKRTMEGQEGIGFQQRVYGYFPVVQKNHGYQQGADALFQQDLPDRGVFFDPEPAGFLFRAAHILEDAQQAFRYFKGEGDHSTARLNFSRVSFVGIPLASQPRAA